ncbi:MPN499 family protein [[Mycoplasma] testudinis]|uniref:MPN499 family protein n=1 Tax=[Mycoplasma] testudinis TaxID=33924 RepID=UPI000488FA3D|nr:hypothetical protein [[Mycoplasma] testudinis]
MFDKFKKPFSKVKVNYVNNLFWIAPGILSYVHGRTFGYLPSKTLKELVHNNDLLEKNAYFSFNSLKEKNCDWMNQLNQMKELSFRWNTETFTKIERDGFCLDESIHELVKIKWDKKALNWIYRGYIPFANKNWYAKNFVTENDTKPVVIRWDKKEFVIDHIIME